MTSRSVFLRVAAAVALTSALAGCGMMDSMRGRNVDRYEATLSGAQEVPPNASRGTGQAEATFNPATSTLSYRVTHSGLSGPATAGHIHGPAGPGANAGPVVPFASAASPITGEARLTPEQVNQLASGQWYVNIHTAANPGGEIRGQLRRR